MERKISRRTFLKGAAALAIASGGACAAHAAWIEPTWVEMNRVDIRIDGLPAAFEGLRFAHMSDLHRHDAVSLPYLERCLKLVAGEEPDALVITGDFVSKSAGYIDPLAEKFDKLTRSFPVYAVLGNHDYWTDAQRISRALREAGVEVLVNDAATIERSGAHLILLGLDDLWEGKPDLARALSRATKDGIKIVLMHNPDGSEDIADRGVDLVLCGHTHGGQVTLPFIGPPIVPSRFGSKYAKGLFKVKKTQMYVSKGVGLIRPAVRFLTRPEIATIRLMRPAGRGQV